MNVPELKIKNEMQRYCIGDLAPYTTNSKESMSRVMEAIITCRGRILDTYREYIGVKRAVILYLIEIPIGSELLFEEISKSKLSKPTEVSI